MQSSLCIYLFFLIIPPLHRRGYTVLPLPVRRSFRPSICPSVRPSVHLSVCMSFRLFFHPSKIFFAAFFSATIDGRNLIFGHKLRIGMPYCGKRLWTRQIPTSCFYTHWTYMWALAHSSPLYTSQQKKRYKDFFFKYIFMLKSK